MSRAHLRSSVTLLALVACAYAASSAQVDDAQAPARQPSVTTDVAQFSPIRFVSPGSAPSLIVHGDADTSVPMDQGETMYAG